MIWSFALIVMIQVALWIYLIKKKKLGVLIFTGLLGIFSIWAYIDAYMRYIYVDPCEGVEGCMNETGMIFVALTILMLASTLISLFVFLHDFYKTKFNLKKHKDL